jgi:hypothetical protein
MVATVKHSRFCCAKCRKDFNNQRMRRGAMLYDLVMSGRFDRQDFKETCSDSLITEISKFATMWRQEDYEANRPRTWNNVKDWYHQIRAVVNSVKTYIKVGRM